MPDLGRFSYITQWFVELGLEFNYVDINAFNNLSGVCLNSWESETLFKMSRTYTSGLYRHKKPDSIAPYMQDNMTGEEPGKMLQQRLQAFAKKVNEK